MAVQDEVPKSRLTLRYKTEVNGVPADIDLPLRLLVLGDLSLGTSNDRKVDLEERKIRSFDGSNTAGLIKDMGIKLNFVVKNKVDPDKAEEIEVKLPIESMRSFSPDEIANQIPKVKGLLLLKKLLLEVESNVANSKEFRSRLNELYASEKDFKGIMEQLKGYESFKLPLAAS
jgi:type VI secretion system protein ImpB